MNSLPAKCTFITSHIMRAFTLSSDPNFGTFQLIKTLIDDYITIAASRHSVFSPHATSHELGESLEEYNGGLQVAIPRLGDGSIDSDPATAVPYRPQPVPMMGMDSQIDPSLFDGLISNEENQATFSFNDQQMTIPQSEAMALFLPKHD